MSKFKVGDKVKLNPAHSWYADNAIKASRLGSVGKITKLDSSYASVTFEFGEVFGISVRNNDPFILVEASTNIEPRDDRAETIAYIRGKRDKLAAEQLKAQKDEESAQKNRIELGARVAELESQIKALEVKPKGYFEVGSRVRVTCKNFTSFGKEGKITGITTAGYIMVLITNGDTGTYLRSELEAI